MYINLELTLYTLIINNPMSSKSVLDVISTSDCPRDSTDFWSRISANAGATTLQKDGQRHAANRLMEIDPYCPLTTKSSS